MGIPSRFRRLTAFRRLTRRLDAALIAAASVVASPFAQAKPNVLLIVVDDLRPQLGCYGHAEMHTPNIDRLAATGVRMTRQFVAAPMCGPSRYAMLTGRRPSRPADLGNNAFDAMRRAGADDAAPESIVDLFRRDGYRTVGLGKISHSPDGRVYGYDKPISEVREMPRSWVEMGLPYGPWRHGWQSFFGYADGTGRTDRVRANQPVPATEAADVADTGYPDGLIAQAAVEKLRQFKRDGKPFLLAVGFFKPHLPFNAPKRYWDLYPASDLAPARDAPLGVHPKLALHASVEAGQYTHPANWQTDAAYQRHLRRGYRASVSYVDAQVGLVLDALERERLADDTIVLLWGDHGFHLGDLSLWGKHSLFDYSLHSPLIVRVPGTRRAGAAADGIVESVDIYPTLADLCGLAAPDGLSGRSLRPMLEDPAAPGRAAAISYWHNGALSLRTDRYRLTRYRRPNGGAAIHELYDLRDDPRETRNVAADHPDVVRELSPQLDAAAWPD